ncbi:hypothetical protein TNCV_1818461 [Trichonephila clavipes]|nr:hypothetical protein TNCV_1818461 [Trichonephila clavipes]
MSFESHSNSTHILLKTGNKGGGKKRTPIGKKNCRASRSVETGHKSANPPHHVDMPKNSKSPSDIQKKKRGWPKNFTNVADRIAIKAPPLMRDFFGGGVPQEKKSAESPELDFTPFPCPALIRDFCGGSAESPELDLTPKKKKKVGGVTGMGLHAVSPSLKRKR